MVGGSKAGDESSEDEESMRRLQGPEEVKAAPKVYEEDYSIQRPLWDIEEVPDWSERIESYTDEQKETYANMVPKVKEFFGLLESKNGWDVLVENKNDRIKIETKRSVRGNQIIRAEGPIDWPPIDVLRCMSYKPFQKEFDLNQDTAETLQKQGVNLLVLHKKTQKKYVVAARDFVVDLIFNREADGTVYNVSSSTNCKYQVPVTKGVVRADTAIGGNMFRVDPNDPNKCVMTIVNEIDLKGSIPDFVLRTAFKD